MTPQTWRALLEQYGMLPPQWDDMKFPFESTRRGATSKPDYDTTNNGLLFPQNDATEITYAVAQLPHHWREGSVIMPHMHYIQDEVAVPTFKINYRWYNNGEAVPGFTTLSTDAGTGPVFTYISGSILQILPFQEIDGTGFRISSMIDLQIYRDDNAVTGDVLGKEFDIHYQIDAFGSVEEFVKQTITY